ncbi:C6 transcription factor [Colletotrichum tofieldiae]|nr:C6 transcription factor [Colletotrichum tofieldiae]
MCHVYGTDCEFPPSPRSAGRALLNPGKVQKSYRTPQSNTPCRREPLAPAKTHAPQNGIRLSSSPPTSTASSSGPKAVLDPYNTHLMLALDSPEDEDNSHIIGPAVTNDTQVLADYLSSEPSIHERMIRVVKPRPGVQAGQVPCSTTPGGVRKPVIFTAVRKRPYGLSPRQTAPLQKYQIVEKMLEPWISALIDL